MTILGPVEFLRARHRPASRKGESFIPIEHQLGLTVGGLTSAAASLSMAFLSSTLYIMKGSKARIAVV